MVALLTAQWTADASRPILDLSVGELLRATASRAPEAVALVEGAAAAAERRRWTYGELLAECERAARALLARFAPGERVAVWANNISEWVVLELAAGLAGVTIVTVNPALRGEELVHVLGQSRPDGIFLVPEYRRVEAAFGAPLSIMFAQTEVSPVITETAPDDEPDDRATTLGRALPHTEVKIVDVAGGATVAPDVIGELCTRGYHVMTEHLSARDRARALRARGRRGRGRPRRPRSHLG